MIVVQEDFAKYEDMAFDPSRYESIIKETDLDNTEHQININ